MQEAEGQVSVILGPISVVIQDPHSLVRACLRLIVNEIEGAEVIGEAASAREALEVAFKTKPDLVLLDLSPRDGTLSVLREIAEHLPATKVICLAEEPSDALIKAAFEAGANGLSLKTDSAEELLKAVDAARKGKQSVASDAAGSILQQYVEVVMERRKRDAAVIETLATAIEAKDSYTGSHIQRVARLATKLALVMEPSLGNSEEVRYGFVLHDVGKIGIPDKILLKRGKLTQSERLVMDSHPIIGAQIVAPLKFGEDAMAVVRNHHERWDGGGYPDRLGGGDIPLAARIFAVADSFDAMTNDRPYRIALPLENAMEELRVNRGTQFDPEAVEAFVEVTAAAEEPAA